MWRERSCQNYKNHGPPMLDCVIGWMNQPVGDSPRLFDNLISTQRAEGRCVMAKRRTKNVDVMIETLLTRLFRTSNSLQRYMAAKRRADIKKAKEKAALRAPKPVKPDKLPKAKPVDLTKPKKLPKAQRPQGYSVEIEVPVPPAPQA